MRYAIYPIIYRDCFYEVRELVGGARLVLRRSARPNSWCLASPGIATAVAAAYDAGLNTRVFA